MKYISTSAPVWSPCSISTFPITCIENATPASFAATMCSAKSQPLPLNVP